MTEKDSVIKEETLPRGILTRGLPLGLDECFLQLGCNLRNKSSIRNDIHFLEDLD
jgi:hypothetical protein